jgi:hypothetical protein
MSTHIEDYNKQIAAKLELLASEKRSEGLRKWLSLALSAMSTIGVALGVFILNAKIEQVVREELKAYVPLERYNREMTAESAKTDNIASTISGSRELLVRMDERLKLLQEHMDKKSSGNNNN